MFTFHMDKERIKRMTLESRRETQSFVRYIDSIAIEACMLPYNHPPDDAGGFGLSNVCDEHGA